MTKSDDGDIDDYDDPNFLGILGAICIGQVMTKSDDGDVDDYDDPNFLGILGVFA